MANQSHPFDDEERIRARAQQLETYHQRPILWGLLVVASVFTVFVVWAKSFSLDEVRQAHGEVIARSRVQVIQAVDGGVLAELSVKEGDRVEAGQMLARLDPTRTQASFGEADARLAALQARIARLRAEVTNAKTPKFAPHLIKDYAETVALERSLFQQRRSGLLADLTVLQEAVGLAQKEQDLMHKLNRAGDASGTELLRTQRNLNEAQTRLLTRKNRYNEDARADLAKAEDEAAQTNQVVTRRRQETKDTLFMAQVSGVVKNIRVTTVGGVLRAGEEIMQIVPVDDTLVVEAKVKPSDIAQVQKGLEATVRFDPFDYTIFGKVDGKVVYVSVDTLKEESRAGVESYYRVHITPNQFPVVSSTGKTLDIQPGMTAQVDIRVGKRTLIDYLLKPLRKTLAESLGEK